MSPKIVFQVKNIRRDTNKRQNIANLYLSYCEIVQRLIFSSNRSYFSCTYFLFEKLYVLKNTRSTILTNITRSTSEVEFNLLRNRSSPNTAKKMNANINKNANIKMRIKKIGYYRCNPFIRVNE